MGIKFRSAERQDTPLILDFIIKLARYEKLENEVVADIPTLEKWLFDEKKAQVVFALDGNLEVGFALYFYNFSTFLGRAGIYLEDLYVEPEYRGKGYGKALLNYLGDVANKDGCGRLEWWCLDSNTPSIKFYKSMGAKPMDEWTVFRIDGDTLKNMGSTDN